MIRSGIRSTAASRPSEKFQNNWQNANKDSGGTGKNARKTRDSPSIDSSEIETLVANCQDSHD
jgi:hypothetical protein